MRIAIVHYHLRRGGVTRVIDSACKALENSGHEVLVISGEAPHNSTQFRDFAIVDGLNYRKGGNSTIASSLAEALQQAAIRHFGSPPDVWHFHNHSLAKNVLVPSVVRELAEEGAKVLLQMHDFPEDGRPGNYAVQRSFFDSEKGFDSTLYPIAKQIHYAAINHRDYQFLKASGVPESNLHEIPNAIFKVDVHSAPNERPFHRDRQFVLYPTRGIRRKNLGELLLLGVLEGESTHFATTLSPENPDWVQIHNQWRGLASELDLPVTLGIADSGEYAFEDLVGWSDATISTSIAEGFGLAFLESWLAGKTVTGRNLPEITRDFADKGITLDHLYQRLEIPVAWLNEKDLRAAMDSVLRQSYLAYDRRMPADAVDRAWKSWVHDGRIDFGVLSERFQEGVIRRIVKDRGLISEVTAPSIQPLAAREIEKKRKLVESLYSLSSYGEKLRETYDTVSESSVGKVKSIDTEKVLDRFLAPERLNLLRT